MTRKHIFFAALVFCGTSVAEETQTVEIKDHVEIDFDVSEDGTVIIPLDQIWAYDMPNTRDIRLLEPKAFGEETRNLPTGEERRRYRTSNVYEIRTSLTGKGGFTCVTKTQPPETIWQEAKPGFAVVSSGLEVLRQAHSVLVEENEPRQVFSADSRISLVFFSNLCGYYVHLDQVALRQNVIEIQFRYVPHMSADLTAHFGLIPLGKLMKADYRVNIIRSPMEQRYVDEGYKALPPDRERAVICRPFRLASNRGSH
jgi:hypothetical protein